VDFRRQELRRLRVFVQNDLEEIRGLLLVVSDLDGDGLAQLVAKDVVFLAEYRVAQLRELPKTKDNQQNFTESFLLGCRRRA
jgi:hypothetical protein